MHTRRLKSKTFLKGGPEEEILKFNNLWSSKISSDVIIKIG